YRSVVAALDEGIVLLDAQGVVQTCNASVVRLLGVPGAQLLGLAVADLRWPALSEDGTPFPPADWPVAVALRTGQSASAVLGLQRPDGQRVWLSLNAQPLRAPGQVHPEAVVVSFA